MGGAKYVMFSDTEFVIFPRSMSHKDVADAIGRTPVSAGFCAIIQKNNDDGGTPYDVRCYGDSLTLNLKPGPNDGKYMAVGLI